MVGWHDQKFCKLTSTFLVGFLADEDWPDAFRMGNSALACHKFKFNLNSTLFFLSYALSNWVATFPANTFYSRTEVFMSFITLSDEAAIRSVHPAKWAAAHKNLFLLITRYSEKVLPDFWNK